MRTVDDVTLVMAPDDEEGTIVSRRPVTNFGVLPSVTIALD